MNKTVQLSKSIKGQLSDIDQQIVDCHLDPRKEYSVDYEESDKKTTFLYLEGVTNMGFDSKWFNIIG